MTVEMRDDESFNVCLYHKSLAAAKLLGHVPRVKQAAGVDGRGKQYG